MFFVIVLLNVYKWVYSGKLIDGFFVIFILLLNSVLVYELL